MQKASEADVSLRMAGLRQLLSARGQRRLSATIVRAECVPLHCAGAVNDPDALYGCTAPGSPDAALRFAAGLQAAVPALRYYPDRCPVTPEAGLLPEDYCQLVVGDYGVGFRNGDGVVRILRILHGAHLLREGMV